MALFDRLGVSVALAEMPAIRGYDAGARRLVLSDRAAPATRRFQLLHQAALLAQADLLEATLDLARFQSDEARAIARIGLANYFAGAALLPYTRFLERRARDAPRSRGAGPCLRRLGRAGGAPAVDAAAPRRQGHPLLLRPRRPGGHDHQAPLGHAASVRALRRRLPALERPPGLRDPGPLPAATGRNAGRRALLLPRARRAEAGRVVPRARAPLCHWPRLRGEARARPRLCRRHGPDEPARLRGDRDLLPDLRADGLPPAIGPAAGTAAAGEPGPAGDAALRDRQSRSRSVGGSPVDNSSATSGWAARNRPSRGSSQRVRNAGVVCTASRPPPARRETARVARSISSSSGRSATKYRRPSSVSVTCPGLRRNRCVASRSSSSRT
jgi:hypothetical protein